MAPKSKSGKSTEEMFEEMMERMNLLTETVEEMKAALKAVTTENVSLKKTIDHQADEIAYLKNSNNDREQYARSWSMRVLNITLPRGQESNTRAIMETVYESLLLPILEGALEAKEISNIPSCEALLETAHPLPGKGEKKPVIVRFYSRYWRSIIFRFRKTHAPREEPSGDIRRGAERTARRMLFPFYEDLSRETFKQLQSIKSCQEVVSAWTVGGVIRFKVKDNDTIFRVTSIYDTVENVTEK